MKNSNFYNCKKIIFKITVSTTKNNPIYYLDAIHTLNTRKFQTI